MGKSSSPLSHEHPLTRLLIIGSNPPTSSGVRTLARAEQACEVLGFDGFELENLFSKPTHRTGDISAVGGSVDYWLEARPALTASLDRATGVVLAHGVSKPSGPAAKHFTDQVIWITDEIVARELPVWRVGGAPRHPSRWHRYTYRTYPGIDFQEALSLSLTVQVDFPNLGQEPSDLVESIADVTRD